MCEFIISALNIFINITLHAIHAFSGSDEGDTTNRSGVATTNDQFMTDVNRLFNISVLNIIINITQHAIHAFCGSYLGDTANRSRVATTEDQFMTNVKKCVNSSFQL